MVYVCIFEINKKKVDYIIEKKRVIQLEIEKLKGQI